MGLLDMKTFFVHEHTGLMKLVDVYDILDPETQQKVGIAKDEPGDAFKYLRIIISKRMLPTTINVYENEGSPPVISIHKPVSFFSQRVNVLDGQRQLLGYFQSKLFAMGGGFWVYDPNGNKVAEVKGNWKGWDFQFLDNSGREMGKITKKWAGLAKEMFTTADNYVVDLSHSDANPGTCALLLAAALAIDIVYKEGD